MYCPVCFNDSLKIRSRGVIKLAFNGKQKDTSLFLYNLDKDSAAVLKEKLKEKIVDFLSWYSEFNNKSPLKTFELYSADFQCKNGCKIDINSRLSVIEKLYTSQEIIAILKEEAERYDIKVEIKKIT